ncbi:MAG: M18 family aminopeptidase, partial [Eisenbergiella sp.]
MNEQILTEEMLKFIEESPTAFHAAANVEKLLQEEGFVRIEELGAEGIQPGGRYYTVQNGSAVIAA